MMMAKILSFLREKQAIPEPVRMEVRKIKPVQAPPKANSLPKTKQKPAFSTLVKVVWMITTLCWPILKWVLSLDVLYQLFRTMYYWDTPGVHAGVTCFLHFALLTAVMYFVASYNPKE